jgi:hypothetical protein
MNLRKCSVATGDIRGVGRLVKEVIAAVRP